MIKFIFYKLINLMLLTLLLSGCAPSNLKYIKNIYLEGDLTARINISEPTDYSKLRTFSTIPASIIDKNYEFEDTAKYNMVLFRLKCYMELIGYNFVELNEKPDFLVSVMVENNIYQASTPSYTTSMPVWNPPSTLTSNVYSNGTFNTRGSSSNGWGTYSGNSTITTEVPGYYTNQEIFVPGQSITIINPVVSVIALYSSNYNAFWMATSSGQTTISDISITSQLLLRNILLFNFPKGKEIIIEHSSNNNGTGINVFTLDGQNYFPIITKVGENSPADRAGIKQYDIVTKINGNNVANVSEKQLMTLPAYNFGVNNSMIMTVFRSGDVIDYMLLK